MRVTIDQLADIGIAKDPTDQTLAPNAWTDAKNIAFKDGKVCRGLGRRKIFDPPTVNPYKLFFTTDASREAAVIYMGLQKAFAYMGGSHNDITRLAGDYTGGASDRWNGGPFAGVLIANNGIDVPQRWAPQNAATPFQDLDNWPADWRASVVRPFGNFLVALAITDTGTLFPHRIVFSHPAAPGAVPVSWDPTDETLDVTERDIVDQDGTPLVDFVPLGANGIIYKEASTHVAQFIGGSQIWRTTPLLEQGGLLAQDCAIRFARGMQHFVASGDDVYVHNGSSPESVVSKKVRRWLQANISSTRYDRSFCFNDVPGGKCWFCFPLEGSDWPNLALVYDWTDGTVTFQEIGLASSIIPALIAETVDDPWAGDTATWDSDTSRWDEFTSKLFLRQTIGAYPEGKLQQLDTLNQFDGVDYTALIEKSGLDIYGLDKYGHLLRDKRKRKLVKGLWPSASGAPFYIQIGTQQINDDMITWGDAKLFTPGVDDKVDFAHHTQLYCFRFYSATDGYWEMTSYDIDVEPLGDF